MMPNHAKRRGIINHGGHVASEVGIMVDRVRYALRAGELARREQAAKDELCACRQLDVASSRGELAVVVQLRGSETAGDGAVTVELRHEPTATWMAAELGALTAAPVDVAATGHLDREVFRLRAVDGAAARRRVGLILRDGSRVKGLPPGLLTGRRAGLVGMWRGAVLAGGCITELSGRPVLEVACVNELIGLGLVGAARRLGVVAQYRRAAGGRSVGADRVEVRGGPQIAALFAAMGAARAARWFETCSAAGFSGRQRKTGGSNFGEANKERAHVAAVEMSSRAERALLIVADGGAAEPLIAAGRLRVAHPLVGLRELGELADPPMSKDTVAGRIRRLLLTADEIAAAKRVPDTRGVGPTRFAVAG
jgi:cell division protein WhiA